MKQNLLQRALAAAVACGTLLAAHLAEAAPKNLLVVTVTKGFRHSSIPTAEKVLADLAQKSGAFTLDFARTDADIAAKMTPEALKQYDGYIFANTTGDLPIPNTDAFLDTIKAGKAFIGMHSASDTFHGKGGQVSPFIEMIGGEFLTHGAQVGVECLVQDLKHPSTKHLGESYCLEQEEIYLFKNYDKSKVTDLLTLDKHPNKKKELGHFPVAWWKTYGQGTVFYTSLGHREDVWESDKYKKHILGGIKAALKLEGFVDAEGFRHIFNGQDLTGWKLRRADGAKSWSVQDGLLVNTVKDGEHGTDLVSEDKYWNFIVRYDYKTPPKSNSGFYLRGRHELQILDDYAEGKPGMGGNAAIYQHTAPAKFASKPPGEWNTVEATMIDNKISMTINGVKVHDNVVCDRATGSELDNKVKEPGAFFLQGDHGSVTFRNIRVKELK